MFNRIALRTAFINTLTADGLDKPALSAFLRLAVAILNSRAGQFVAVGDVQPAVKVLENVFPDLTVGAYMVERVDVADFNDLMFEHTFRDPFTLETSNIYTIPPGLYYATSSLRPQDILRFVDFNKKPALGDVYLVFDVGEQPGYEYGQLKTLLTSYQDVLIAAASDVAPNLVATLKSTLASLTRAQLKIPYLSFINPKSSMKMTFRTLAGVVNFAGDADGTFYPRSQLPALQKKLKSFYKPVIVKPGTTRMGQFAGKKIACVGTPPQGWSTDRFGKYLSKIKADVSTTVDAYTNFVFYNPDQSDNPKLLDAARFQIPMIAYNDAISTIIV